MLRWHTAEWWRQLWERTGLVQVEAADVMPDGCARYARWKRARAASGDRSPSLAQDIEVLDADAGAFLGFIRMVARRMGAEAAS